MLSRDHFCDAVPQVFGLACALLRRDVDGVCTLLACLEQLEPAALVAGASCASAGLLSVLARHHGTTFAQAARTTWQDLAADPSPHKQSSALLVRTCAELFEHPGHHRSPDALAMSLSWLAESLSPEPAAACGRAVADLLAATAEATGTDRVGLAQQGCLTAAALTARLLD